MKWRPLNLLTLLALLTGCSATRTLGPDSARAVTRDAASPPAAPAARPPRGPASGVRVYWQCDEAEADTVLVATVISADATESFDLPLKTYPLGEVPTVYVYASQGVRDATRYALHYWLSVDDNASEGVTLRVSVHRVGGVIETLFNTGGARRQLTVPADRPSEHRLSDAVTLRVSFRQPRRDPSPLAPGSAGPAGLTWEQRLEQERRVAPDYPRLPQETREQTN